MRIFWESIQVYFRIKRLSARQWIHLCRQSAWLWYFTHFLREGELVSCGPLRVCFCLSTETGFAQCKLCRRLEIPQCLEGAVLAV